MENGGWPWPSTSVPGTGVISGQVPSGTAEFRHRNNSFVPNGTGNLHQPDPTAKAVGYFHENREQAFPICVSSVKIYG